VERDHGREDPPSVLLGVHLAEPERPPVAHAVDAVLQRALGLSGRKEVGVEGVRHLVGRGCRRGGSEGLCGQLAAEHEGDIGGRVDGRDEDIALAGLERDQVLEGVRHAGVFAISCAA
jgi:hypothetical protein